jgi:hypothetical protein
MKRIKRAMSERNSTSSLIMAFDSDIISIDYMMPESNRIKVILGN